jgi:hypothetical protein
MGYHADVYKGLADLVITAVPDDMPVLNVLTEEEVEFDRHNRSVCILRENIGFEPHPEINPQTAVADQPETWEWTLYVTGGAGKARAPDSGAEIDLYLELIRTALNAQRLTSDCGPLHLTSEDFEGRDGAKVTYTQRWTHRRLE